MNSNLLPKSRRKQVLRLLHEHEPLSVNGIASCLSPLIDKRDLRRVIQRLVEKNLLTLRIDRGRISGKKFFQLAGNPQARKKIERILGETLPPRNEKQVRYAELGHSEECAIWCELLRFLLPGVEVIRDFKVWYFPWAMNVLNIRNAHSDIFPDVLMRIPSESGKNIVVAIEVERSMKSKERLIQKLRKYADETKVDGVLYVVRETSLEDKLASLFKEKVLPKNCRVSYYGDDFLTFSDGRYLSQSNDLCVISKSKKLHTLKLWINTIQKNKSA